MDWEEAKGKLISTLEMCKFTVGCQRTIMGPYLMAVGNLITRYNCGDRTPEFYDEIMEMD